MKDNKFFSILIKGVIISFICVNASIAEPMAGSNVMPINQIMAKFAVTMCAVFLSIIVIWFGLKLFQQYARNQFELNRKKMLQNDSSDEPKDIDQAIVSFISKNKL